MNIINLNQSRYEKLIKDYEKNILETEACIAKMKILIWDLKMAVEKDKGEEEKKDEYNS